MLRTLHVLIVEDNPADAELVLRQIRRAGFEPEWRRVDTAPEFLASLHDNLDIILSDFEMPQFSGLCALELLRESGLEIPFIIISGAIGEETAVAAMKQGAVDYLLKDRLTRLGPAISQALDKSKLRRERRQSERQLRESEERFREVVQNIAEVFWMTNVEKSEMLFVSAAYEKSWGRTCASLYASPMTWLETIHPEDRDRVLHSASTKQIEGTYHEEYRIVRPDGSIRWVNDRAFPVRNEEGTVHRIAGVARDITERKRAEEHLRQREAMLANAQRIGRMGTWILDLRSGRLEWSEATCELFGIAPGDFAGTFEHFYSFIIPEDRSGCDAEQGRISLARPTLEAEYRIRRPDGQVRWMFERGNIEFDADGNQIRRLGMVMDITERKQTEAALRLFRALVDQSAATFEVIDPVTARFLDVNANGPAELGCTREEYLSLRIFDVDPMVAESAWPQLAEQIRAADSLNGEGRHQRKDGTSFPVEFNAKWVHLDRDYIVAVVRDITERKRAEEILRESSRQKVGRQKAAMMKDLAVIGAICILLFVYFFFFDPIRAPVEAFATKHFDNLDDFVEGGVVIMFGTVAFFYRRWRDFQDQARQEAQIQEALRTLRDELEARVQQRTLDLSKSNEALRNEIVERKRGEERVREQAAMLDLAHDAIIVRGFNNHTISFWSRGAESLYGWPASEATGRDVGELICVDPVQPDEIRDALLTTDEWRGETRHQTKIGKQLTVNTRATLVRDAGGAPTAVLSINTDITEQKDLEGRFLRAQRMESIGTLAGGIAHDLNNCLGPIIMSFDILKAKFTDPASRELLDIVGASAQRGADMVRQVLSFGRGVEGRRIELQIKHIVREIEKIVGDTFLKNIVVRTSIPHDLWTVVGDPTQLHQVLLNLCVNARDAMPEGGKLRISAENITLDAHYAGLNPEAHPGPYVVLHVEDTGTGMPPEVLEKIFDPFFTTKEIGKGTGLGLSTSLGIVQSHGGFLRVESAVGEGTKFHIHLPAQIGDLPDEAAEAAAELPRGHGELILVVDDEASVRAITGETLETFGYRVVFAGDGAEACSVFASRGPEIAALLVDIVMPVMDGPTTIQVLRRMNPRLPIIAASGLATSAQTAQMASLGVKHFLSKPFTAGTLLRTLRQTLAEQPQNC